MESTANYVNKQGTPVQLYISEGANPLFSANSLAGSLTGEEKGLLLSLCDEAERLGASKEVLAPFFAAIFFEQIDEKDLHMDDD